MQIGNQSYPFTGSTSATVTQVASSASTVFSQLDLSKLLAEKAELEALLKDKNDLIKDVEALKTPKVDK